MPMPLKRTTLWDTNLRKRADTEHGRVFYSSIFVCLFRKQYPSLVSSRSFYWRIVASRVKSTTNAPIVMFVVRKVFVKDKVPEEACGLIARKCVRYAVTVTSIRTHHKRVHELGSDVILKIALTYLYSTPTCIRLGRAVFSCLQHRINLCGSNDNIDGILEYLASIEMAA